MTINSASINDNVTSIAPTGGTAITLVGMGLQNNAVKAYVSQDTSMKTRRTAEFSAKAPIANPNSLGGYTQAYKKVKLLFPRTLTDGKITYDELMIQHRTDISATNAEINNQRYIGAQILCDGDFDSFWQALNLS